MLLAGVLLLAAGCRTPTPPPMVSPIEGLPHLGAYAPDQADREAHAMAAAALLSRREAGGRALQQIERFDAERAASGELPTGLAPFGRNLLDSTLDDAIAYREATRALLERGDLDPGLRARLEAEAKDDPLELAEQRLRDSRLLGWGRLFNLLVEPVGRSILTSALLPVRLARALLGIALLEHAKDELSLPERQALVHWKRFLETHPDAPEAQQIVELVEESQLRWYRTQRDRNVRGAARALEKQENGTAFALAERALRYAPEDRRATRLRDEAGMRLARRRAKLGRSVAAPIQGEGVAAGRPLALALLAESEAIAGRAEAILEADPQTPLAAEARFALALSDQEAGRESTHWNRLEHLADQGNPVAMARHARHAVRDPEQNPLRAFRVALREQRGQRLGWLFLGSLAGGPRERDLPRLVEWMVDLPAFLESLIGIPNRLVRYLWQAPRSKAPRVWASRAVERHPDGETTPDLLRWLEEESTSLGNHPGALQWAELRPDADPGHLEKLRRRAAEQALEVASRESRRDLRLALLRRVARDYRGTEAAQTAGEQVRYEAAHPRSQQIRISRAFLQDNPQVAGPTGLGVRSEFLDGNLRNGELHRDGVTLEGGRQVAFSFVAESGWASDEPAVVRRRISRARLARLVALLEETSIRLALVDPDFQVEPDADRDLFFERARLGLADEPDLRATAQSSYAFESMREKYGMVRSRESILPVELVLKGSIGGDFGIGAFPRIRMPKPTDDALLYR